MIVKVNTYKSKLQFRFPFRIAHGVRTSTDVVLVRLDCEGVSGFGEATLPPYLPDTVDDVLQFLQSGEVNSIHYPFDPAELFYQFDSFYPGVMPAKAALDMALWSLKSRMENIPLRSFFGIECGDVPPHTYTIGLGSKQEMQEKLMFGQDHGFVCFKLKLDGKNDERIVGNFKELSDCSFAVDANQGWNDLSKAVALSQMLEKNGCFLIEQPFEKSDLKRTAELATEISIPIVADEACQRMLDMERLTGSFDGINVKLQKCGGMTEALKMIRKAKDSGLKVLIGCMSESSVGCDMAETLAPLCDWADLDGPFLINNNDAIRREIGY